MVDDPWNGRGVDPRNGVDVPNVVEDDRMEMDVIENGSTVAPKMLEDGKEKRRKATAKRQLQGTILNYVSKTIATEVMETDPEVVGMDMVEEGRRQDRKKIMIGSRNGKNIANLKLKLKPKRKKGPKSSTWKRKLPGLGGQTDSSQPRILEFLKKKMGIAVNLD